MALPVEEVTVPGDKGKERLHCTPLLFSPTLILGTQAQDPVRARLSGLPHIQEAG